RCFCNFNPCISQQSAVSVAQINAIIHEGIEYFRNVLRICRHLIQEDLKDPEVSEDVKRQVNVILSDDPLVPLQMETIRLLNRAILKNARDFVSEIRKIKK
ncbi:MAG: hypothetical protein QXK06_04145, partial [Candidatus Diapherotrites archaeon]